jgi:TatD DNase family protein
MQLVDSHCHFDFPAFDADRDDVYAHCQQLGVNQLIVPAVTRKTWHRLTTVCDAYEGMHYALGLHPMFMGEHSESDIQALEDSVSTTHPIAIGEIGLDFYHGHDNAETQLYLFEKQLKLAKQLDLPVILHVRKAHDDVLKLLRRYQLKGGTVHAFSGSEQQAQQYIDLGFVLGIGGALTYTRAHKLHRLFAALPNEAIVLETDAPDMPLSGHHGQRNSPEYLPDILKKLASLRQQNDQELALATTQNCERIFNVATPSTHLHAQ